MFELILQIASNLYFFALHVTGAGSFPKPLSLEEENTLIKASNEGDIEARNKLIEHNLRLVAHIVKKYYATGAEPDDLISIGTIGLIKAVSTFKTDKKIRLATYAARCIEKEILSLRLPMLQIALKYVKFAPKYVKMMLNSQLLET